MSQVEILRHAIDAARAGNPELARVHLQKAAEIVPDDPAVWLWLSWLSDSPVSMIQCLELVRRHDDYREIAEAGLAFARGLARFDCDALLPEAPEECPPENDNTSEKARSADESKEAPIEEGPNAKETIAEAESGELEVEAETIAEVAEPSSDDTDSQGESLTAPEVEKPAQESGKTQESPIEETLEEQPEIEPTEGDETAALDNLDDIDEEFESAASSLWDGIALLSRTADAVADELKADSELPAEEVVGSEETAVSELEPNHVDPDASPLDEQIEAGSDSEACEEGNSWFDYWLPEDERAAENSSLNESNANQASEETAASPEILSAEVAETATDTQETSSVTEDELVRQETVQDESSEPAATDEPAEVSGKSSVDEDEPRPAVLEIVEGNPFEEPSADGEQPTESHVEAEHSDSVNAESDAETAGGYVPPVAQTVFDIPVALQGDAEPLPPTTDSEEESADEEATGWSAPTPAHQSEDVWRAAQSDWFSVGHQQNAEALIPHENPPSEPPAAASSGPTAHAAYSPPVTPGQPEVRTANQSIFDAEPTRPALIPASQPALDAGSQTHPETGLARVENGSTEGIDESAETGLGRPLAEEQPQTEGTQNETQENAPRPQARIKSGDARTVLVVDDSPTVRKLVEMSLERNGFRVVHAFDGVAAIKEIARQNPSLILMDVNMPRLDGYQLCKLVKKHETTRHIPVVMLTSKEGVFDKLKGRLVGCSGYIAKPFSPEELVTAVEQFLAEPATL